MALANVDYPKYIDKICFLKEKYKHQITIKLGMEFGMQTHTVSQYEKVFSRYPFDFIILSVHQVEDKEFWTQDLTPSRDILRLYKELGGKIITIGSDSHKKEHLGTYLRETKQELLKLGFKQYCTYEKMRPIYHDITM